MQRRVGRIKTVAALLACDEEKMLRLISEAELVIASGSRMTPSNLIYLMDYASVQPQGIEN